MSCSECYNNHVNIEVWMFYIFDIDGVISNIYDAMASDISDRLHKEVSSSEFVRYDFWREFSFDSHHDFLEYIVSRDVLIRGKPYKDTIKYLQSLSASGHKIHYVTARGFHPDAYRITKLWLSMYGAPFDGIHISGESKVDIFKTIEDEIHYFVDDCPKNVIEAVEYKRFKKVYLLDRPWNQGLTGDFTRIKHINEME